MARGKMSPVSMKGGLRARSVAKVSRSSPLGGAVKSIAVARGRGNPGNPAGRVSLTGPNGAKMGRMATKRRLTA